MSANPYLLEGGSIDAEAHAQRASQLLALVERQEDELAELAELEPERHLALASSGELRRLAENRRWSVELARAHALTAIAQEVSALCALSELVG
jgi:hypothetical protein